MKKIVNYLISILVVLLASGCFNENNMEDINIYTTSYPIEYITNRLYGENNNVLSIYPNGIDISTYKVTDTLLKSYNNADLYIFDGLGVEKDYMKPLLKTNPKLKIIDSTSSLKFENSINELWLDPSKLLTIANNIKKGLNEYISLTVLKDKIQENYNNLKIDLTNLDAKYRSDIKKSSVDTIVVSDDMFLYLQKYSLNVISLDSDSVTQKNINDTKELIKKGKIKYIFIKQDEKVNDTINNLINGTNIKTLELNTLSNLTDEERNKYDYLSLSNQNLETLKEELY